MPQLNKTVLKDRSENPDRTFVPSDIRDNVGFLAEASDTPLGSATLSVSMRRPTGQRKNFKGLVKLTLPVTDECPTTCTTRVKHVVMVQAEFTFPPTSTEAERNNAVGLLASALDVNTELINKTLVNLEGVY